MDDPFAALNERRAEIHEAQRAALDDTPQIATAAAINASEMSVDDAVAQTVLQDFEYVWTVLNAKFPPSTITPSEALMPLAGQLVTAMQIARTRYS